MLYRATDDDWVADFTCLYTDDLRDRLNAPKTQFTKKVHLHKGFWTAYKAVDGQLMTEIKAQVLRIKVRIQLIREPSTVSSTPSVVAVDLSESANMLTAGKQSYAPGNS